MRSSIQIPLRTNYRSFSSSKATPKGLSPESSDPEPPKTQDHASGTEAAELSEAEYHEFADQYLNTLVLALEDLADTDKGGDPVEVEFAVSILHFYANHADISQAGVLTVGHPKKGSYVLNKQPPNRQIWLSSPVSGPKRFDWTVPKSTSGGMNSKQDQEDSHGDVGDDGVLGGGKWVYLRDGTTLSGLLREELGVVVAKDEDADVSAGREGPGASGASGVEG